MARGGLKFLRGTVADYVTYFLDVEGKGCTDHGYYGSGSLWNASESGLLHETTLSATSYANWLSGADPDTGELRGGRVTQGELRSGVRAYEYGVNVPKSASIVAALNPELGRALMMAQERAAIAGLAVIRAAARSRFVAVKGEGQTQVGVDTLEVAVFAHDGSREGDPHHHLHVQVGSKVFVEGKWRSLHGPAMVRAIGAWQATVAASIATDAQWVRACASHGLTVGSDGGVVEIHPDVEEVFSSRHVAIQAEMEKQLAAFRVDNGRVPTARERVIMDQRAWSLTRPKKGERALLTAGDIATRLRDVGAGELVQQITGPGKRSRVSAMNVPAVKQAAWRLAVQREGLTDANIQVIAAEAINVTGGVCADIDAAISEVAQSVRDGCVSVTAPGGVSVWVPTEVLESAEIVRAHLLHARDHANVHTNALRALDSRGLTPGQRAAAEAVAAGLPVVIEGAAGTGKTHALHKALDARNAVGLNTVAVAPSAAAVTQMGQGWTAACTVHSLLLAGGWDWDEPAGLWAAPGASRALDERLRDSVLIVDEAAMLDLHTMAALAQHATRHGARLVLVGDDRQLSAVGVAGGFTLAAAQCEPIRLYEAQRFTDPSQARLAAAWREATDVEALLDQVMASGVVQLYATDDDARIAVAELAAASKNIIVMAADNAMCAELNTLVRQEKEHAGVVGGSRGRFGRLREPMGVGDVIQTRRNDNQGGLVNRQRWIIDEIHEDKSMSVHRMDKPRIITTLEAAYVKAHVHRADVVTVHAAQGATANQGHALVDESWTREQAYVALTRGREVNVLHVVAESIDAVRDLLRSVITSSDRGRAEALARIVATRANEARSELTPSLFERMKAALRGEKTNVGTWGSGSAFGAHPAASENPTVKVSTATATGPVI